MISLATSALALVGLVAGQSVDLGSNDGTPQNLASGVIYGMMLNDQIPAHFFSDVGLIYGRGSGGQLPAPNRGWSYGEYEGRFQASLTQYGLTRRQDNGKFILLPHDVWGIDFRTDSYVWPGDNGNWTSYDNFLDQLISDIKANNMVDGLVWDIWNEADGYFWNGNRTQWLELYRRTHVRLRSDPDLAAMEISGPTHAGYPSTSDPWWTEWAQMVVENNIIPDQYAWHQEGGGDPTDSATNFAALRQQYGLPDRTININEYATYNEMVAGGYAWYIAKFERLNWYGLLGDWNNGANLYDCLSNLLTKNPAGSFDDISNTDYVPAAGYWIYNYYTKSMTGYRVSSTATSDGNCDVFGTVGTDKVRLLTSCHFNTVNYNIAVNNLQALGFNDGDNIEVQVTKFNSTSNPQDIIDAPFSVGSFTMGVSGGSGNIPVYPVDTIYAYAFEFNLPSAQQKKVRRSRVQL